MAGRAWRMPPRSRPTAGAALTVIGVGVAVLLMLPIRSRLSVDTAALVLVVPVALGVAVGGFVVAPVGVGLGFLAFDFFFIPPYQTFRVAAGEHWVSAGVYGAVALVVGVVVAQLQTARAVAEERASEVRILHDLAQEVAGADSLDAALHAVARLARERFELASVAVLLGGDGGGLRVAASEGEPFSEGDIRVLVQSLPLHDFGPVGGAPGMAAGPLPTGSGPAGVLAVVAVGLGSDRLRLLSLFSGQAGAAVERARLAEETSRARTLAEVDRLRSSVMGAVSHDLRTPLASIKAAVSDLADPTILLDEEDRRVLLTTIEEETDRLTRLVSNLLDMGRIEAGALRLDRSATPLEEMVDSVLVRFAKLCQGPVSVQIAPDLPLVDVDYLLVEQVLANLLENVVRHCPPGTAVDIGASKVGAWVEVRVSDDGPGIRPGDAARIFELFERGTGRGDGGPGAGRRTGMGLAICRGIVEAHGGSIWVERSKSGGSCFVFRLPVWAPSRLVDVEDAEDAATGEARS